MWNLKCTIIPVITGTTGIVTRSLRKNLEAVSGRHSIDSLQKTAILADYQFNAFIIFIVVTSDYQVPRALSGPLLTQTLGLILYN